MTDIISREPVQRLADRNPTVTDMSSLDSSWSMAEGRQLAEKLLRRKFQILAIGFLIVIPVAIATHLATPLYRSTALLKIDADTVQVLPYRDIADNASVTPYYEMYMKTQEQVIQSSTLAARVAERLNSGPNSEAMRSEAHHLGSHFGVRRVQNTQLIELSYVAPNPDVAAGIVNLFAEEYIKEIADERRSTRDKASKLLEEELKQLEQRVQASEQGLVRYASNNKMSSVESGKPDLTEEKLSQLASQLTSVEAEVVVCRSKQQTLARASLENFPDKLLTSTISSLASRVLQAEQELTSLETNFGKNWPDVIKKRNELSVVRDQLQREKSMVLDKAREQAEMDLLSAQSRHDMIADSMKQQQELVDRYRSVSIQYNNMKREAETNKKLHDGLLERLKQTSVTAGLEFSNIHVIEPGLPNATVYSPKIAWNLGLASLIGLAIGICFALAKDFWDNSISSVEEAEQITSLPILGSVPVIKGLKSKALIGAGNGDSPKSSHGSLLLSKMPSLPRNRLPLEAAEDIRSICASILLSKSDHPPRIIMVSSTTPGEGKTTILAGLGQAFADAGNKTLLVEADMRRPRLSQVVGIPDEGGLSLFLSGHISPLPFIHSTSTPNLHAVSAGPHAPNPGALLGSKRLDYFLKEMSASFQFILLDAPPLLSFADARILSLKADGVVLVVRAEHTPKNLIRRARSLLDKSGVNILGMVLNRAPRSGLEASYYRYYRK
jgi:succinoglycan biosynthesis transport protein ExoP